MKDKPSPPSFVNGTCGIYRNGRAWSEVDNLNAMKARELADWLRKYADWYDEQTVNRRATK